VLSFIFVDNRYQIVFNCTSRRGGSTYSGGPGTEDVLWGLTEVFRPLQ